MPDEKLVQLVRTPVMHQLHQFFLRNTGIEMGVILFAPVRRCAAFCDGSIVL